MKKLFFAAIAASFVFVSVNNVFASKSMVSNSAFEPTDIVAPTDTVAPVDTTKTPVKEAELVALLGAEPTDTVAPVDTVKTPVDSTKALIALLSIEPTDTVIPNDTVKTPVDSTKTPVDPIAKFTV